MSDIFKINSGIKAMSFLAVLMSLGMIIYGFIAESYWRGLGLVLLTTAILQTLGIAMARSQRVGEGAIQSKTPLERIAS